MRCFLFLIGFFLLAMNLSFAEVPVESPAVVSETVPASDYIFDQKTHDFKEIQANKPVKAVFKLTNNGTKPLLILDVKISCKCTKINWPRQPVLPGKTAELTLTYKDRVGGAFYKTIEVITNSNPPKTKLILKGTVVK